MGVDGVGEGVPTVELDELLLEAKTSVPEAHEDRISRDELITRARNSARRVVGVTAPAGYGKSTLLTQWAHAEDRRVAWASLDRLDDDPSGFLAVLAAAFIRVAPDQRDLVADVSGAGVSPLGRGAPRLATALRTAPGPFVLMLDDLHEIRAPECHDVLGVVLSGVPTGSQVVAASRSEQPHLARLRASGDAIELVSDDLALDVEGALHVFASNQVDVGHDVAAILTERTEGWPVGLHLAALIAAEGRDDALEISGDDRYVADYLYREAVVNLPEATQAFLRRSSVLDNMSAPLCDAVVGATDAQHRLHQLEAAGLFLVPLDRRRGWFRYHALFREFLLGELRRIEPDLVPLLHLAAADWYEANGSPSKSMEHLLETDERDRAVRLMAALVLPTYQVGQISTLERWLDRLGNDAVAGYPPLAVLAGWIAVARGDAPEAERLLAVIDSATFDDEPTDGSAGFDSTRAMFRSFMCPDGPDRAMADALVGLEAEPPWSPWRDQALGVAGIAHLLVGEPKRAADLLAECEALAPTFGNTDNLVVSASELALLALDAGQWSDARDHIEVAIAAIDEHRMHDYATCVLAFACAARLALHRGDLAEAERRRTQAMRARTTCTYAMPAVAVRVRIQLAKLSWAMGDHGSAHHFILEIDDLLAHRPQLGAVLDEVAELRATVAPTGHDQFLAASPLSPAELRLLPYLQTHLTMREIAERLYLSRNTVSSEVSSIYRKLGVTSRSAAVDQATAVGLLGG